MTDWSPPDPSTLAATSSGVSKEKVKGPSLFQFWQNNFKYIGLIVAIVGSVDFYRLLELQGESRTSLAANSRALEIIDASGTAVPFAVVLTLIWMLHMRRRLKTGIIKKFSFNWRRGLSGLFLPPIQFLFWTQDIEQLAQMPRNQPATTADIRRMRRSRNGYLWFILLFVFLQIRANLNYAKLGIDYVTVGPAGINDPLRYVLKYVDPTLITTNLDMYAEYIWPACVGTSFLSVFFGIVTWKFLGKVTELIKSAERVN
jgi:hypothetical protein